MFEINDLLNKAKAGDLNSRIELNVKGDYKELVSSFNQLLDAVIKPIQRSPAGFARTCKREPQRSGWKVIML